MAIRMPTALIVIDMQQGSFTSETPRHDADALVERLNALAARVRAAGGCVIFVQHNGSADDPHHPSLPGWRLLPDLVTTDADTFICKRACDAFLQTDLENILRRAGADQLIVTGCATDFCVDTTVRSALAHNFRTIAPADGHTTADRPHLPASAVIEHHNWVWSRLISPAGPARLTRCADVQL
jgi:nicotinamidase-related amidase